MSRKTRNITGRNVTPSGTRLNSGLDTITTFDLVTAAPTHIAANVRMRFSNSQNTSNDYFSSELHNPQFTTSAGTVLVDGVSYNNKFIAKHAQFIAPYGGHVKSVRGYMVATGSNSCAAETITVSAWSKTADVAGLSNTAMNLIFSQDLAFTSTHNEYVLSLNSADAAATYNKLTLTEGEGVIFSVKRTAGTNCAKFAASLTMVFESTDSQGATGEFMFPSLSECNGRIDETISSPDASYLNAGTVAKKISD